MFPPGICPPIYALKLQFSLVNLEIHVVLQVASYRSHSPVCRLKDKFLLSDADNVTLADLMQQRIHG